MDFQRFFCVVKKLFFFLVQILVYIGWWKNFISSFINMQIHLIMTQSEFYACYRNFLFVFGNIEWQYARQVLESYWYKMKLWDCLKYIYLLKSDIAMCKYQESYFMYKWNDVRNNTHSISKKNVIQFFELKSKGRFCWQYGACSLLLLIWFKHKFNYQYISMANRDNK